MSTTTQSVEISDVQGEIDGLVERVKRGETRILVEKGGVPMAVIVSMDDFALLERRDLEREQRFEALAEASRAFADVPVEEIEARVAEALLEARAQLRAERQLAEQKLAARQ